IQRRFPHPAHRHPRTDRRTHRRLPRPGRRSDPLRLPALPGRDRVLRRQSPPAGPRTRSRPRTRRRPRLTPNRTPPMTVTVVVGNPKPASRTLTAATLLAEGLAPGAEPTVLDLVHLGPKLLTWGDEEVAEAVRTVAGS